MISPAARSIDALNCGNVFSAAATTFTMIAVTVRLPPAASACFAYFFRSSSSAGDVGEIVLRDVRNGRPGGAQMLRRFSPHRTHRLSLDCPKAREVGQRDGGRGPAADSGARNNPFRVLLHVFDEMRPAVPRALDVGDVDAELARHAADRRRRRAPAGFPAPSLARQPHARRGCRRLLGLILRRGERPRDLRNLRVRLFLVLVATPGLSTGVGRLPSTCCSECAVFRQRVGFRAFAAVACRSLLFRRGPALVDA